MSAELLKELTHSLAWADQEARDLGVCQFPKREAKARRTVDAIKEAIERLDDLEKGLNEWRELALSQAGDAGIVARMVKAETEASLLSVEVGRLREELDSATLARMVADFVKRDAYRYRKLLMQGKHWLGVFRCDPDGTPSDSISADELSALLDAMDGPEMLPAHEAP